MSVAVRDELRKLVDALPDRELETARDALTELLRHAAEKATEGIEAKVDRRMLKVGLMEAVPRREDILNWAIDADAMKADLFSTLNGTPTHVGRGGQ
jgi:polyhydroxyalkanoate synthesis regulator phasin